MECRDRNFHRCDHARTGNAWSSSAAVGSNATSEFCCVERAERRRLSHSEFAEIVASAYLEIIDRIAAS